jgi:hypothetical protein
MVSCPEVTVLKNQSVYPDIEPPADVAPSTTSTPEIYFGATDECTDWQNARDRVLLYLRSINMPPILGLSIALDVLRRAVKKCEVSTEYYPAQAAMLSLHEVLTERNLFPETRAFWDRRKIFCTSESTIPLNETAGILSETAAFSGGLPVAPPLKRGHMQPGFMDRKPVRSFFGRLFRRKKEPDRPVSKRTTKVPQRMVANGQPPEVRDEP